MTNIAVNDSTIRISVANDRDLTRLITTYADYIAIVHHDDGKQLLIYDSCTLLQGVIEGCLTD